MASASHRCTLPMTISEPAGPQNLLVMSTMESGTGVGTHRQFVCLHAGPPYVNACKLIHVGMNIQHWPTTHQFRYMSAHTC